MTLDKKTLAALIDAYADAKASKNQHLVNIMVSQVESALDTIFSETPAQEESPNEP